MAELVIARGGGVRYKHLQADCTRVNINSFSVGSDHALRARNVMPPLLLLDTCQFGAIAILVGLFTILSFFKNIVRWRC